MTVIFYNYGALPDVSVQVMHVYGPSQHIGTYCNLNIHVCISLKREIVYFTKEIEAMHACLLRYRNWLFYMYCYRTSLQLQPIDRYNTWFPIKVESDDLYKYVYNNMNAFFWSPEIHHHCYLLRDFDYWCIGLVICSCNE